MVNSMSDDNTGFNRLWIGVHRPIAAEPEFRGGWRAHDDGKALADNPYPPFSTPYHAWNTGFLASKQAAEDAEDDDDDDDNDWRRGR
jgi:hypothetical protein